MTREWKELKLIDSPAIIGYTEETFTKAISRIARVAVDKNILINFCQAI